MAFVPTSKAFAKRPPEIGGWTRCVSGAHPARSPIHASLSTLTGARRLSWATSSPLPSLTEPSGPGPCTSQQQCEGTREKQKFFYLTGCIACIWERREGGQRRGMEGRAGKGGEGRSLPLTLCTKDTASPGTIPRSFVSCYGSGCSARS